MRNLLVFLGLILMALLAAVGAVIILAFFNRAGIPAPALVINGTPVAPPGLEPLQTLVAGTPRIERRDPLEGQPLPDPFAGPTLFPEQIPTQTPVPLLDPVVYRSEVLIRARSFASALENFLAANDRLALEPALLDDPGWRSEMNAILDQVGATGSALAEIGPPPAEYEPIDLWLDRAGPEAVKLAANYRQALETGEARFFTEAGDNLNRIREYLTQARLEMARAGWPEQ